MRSLFGANSKHRRKCLQIRIKRRASVTQHRCRSSGRVMLSEEEGVEIVAKNPISSILLGVSTGQFAKLSKYISDGPFQTHTL